jgi:hypothetical protein
MRGWDVEYASRSTLRQGRSSTTTITSLSFQVHGTKLTAADDNFIANSGIDLLE